ncbi:hypothetical protein SO802_018731 [Lithocarpus litseifolius]|uniref:Uncharacterized protein n=1 Tax=Lithocarpus litseifolius TaxID=425828 RepID=A0AAW2CM85_9ROSI
MKLWKEKNQLEVLEIMELLQEKSLEQVKVVAYELPYEEDPEEALEILPPNMVDDDWNYLVNLRSNKDWKTMCDKNKYSHSKNFIIHITRSKSLQQRSEEEEKTGEDPSSLQLFEITHTSSNGQAANETTQEALYKIINALLMQMKFKRLTTKVAKGSLQMSGDEMFVEVFGLEHRGRVRGYGDSISPTKLWGSSSSTIRDLQMQLKESEERCKKNDANLLRQLKESKERSKENDTNLLRKLKESEEHRKESDANVQLLKAQVNRVESLLAQVLKNMAPFELAQSDCSSKLYQSG